VAITIITGVPGEGKSLYGARLAIEELENSTRHIVTNLPLDSYALNAEFQKRHEDGCISDRITFIDDDELEVIFTLKNRYPLEGRLFILDEAHIAFNSRKWQTTGDDVLFYLSQHRKLGDDVICITQSAGNLDKQFRSVAQDFVRCRNHSTKRAGFFRGGNKFSANYFETEAMRGEPARSITYKIDWMANCYDTARGVGIQGSKADKGKKRKGIPIWIGALVAVLFVVALGFVPFLLGKFATPLLTGTKTDEPKTQKLAKIQNSQNPNSTLFKPHQTDEDLTAEHIPEITGKLDKSGKRYFSVNDGTLLYPSEYISFSREGVVLTNGDLIPFAISDASAETALESMKARQNLRIAEKVLLTRLPEVVPLQESGNQQNKTSEKANRDPLVYR